MLRVGASKLSALRVTSLFPQAVELRGLELRGSLSLSEPPTAALTTATARGGLVLAQAPADTESRLTLTNCKLTHSAASAGGLLFVAGGMHVTLNNCEIRAGLANVGGGVFCGDGAQLTLNGCHGEGNRAVRLGGAVVAGQGSTVTLSESTLRGNTARCAMPPPPPSCHRTCCV